MLNALRLFFLGLCMGIADLIPGISGGTVAFMVGIYDQLLQALKSLKFQSVKKMHLGFLLPLGSGIALCFLTLSQLIHRLLNHPSYASSLYGFFFGTVLAAAYFCSRAANWKSLSAWLLFFLGALLAFWCSGQIRIEAGSMLHPVLLIIAGALASFAMLLPGISGSYILTLLGIYPVAIKALADVSSGWPILLPLLIGILSGLCFFSRLVSYLLHHLKGPTVAFLAGCMVGGLRAVNPLGRGESSPLFPIIFLAIGLILVIFLELRRDLKINLDRVE